MRKLLFLAFGLALLGAAWAQTVLVPNPVAVACAYNTVLPTGTDGTFVYVQCNSSGQLLVH